MDKPIRAVSEPENTPEKTSNTSKATISIIFSFQNLSRSPEVPVLPLARDYQWHGRVIDDTAYIWRLLRLHKVYNIA
jgi:hypothetical protein